MLLEMHGLIVQVEKDLHSSLNFKKSVEFYPSRLHKPIFSSHCIHFFVFVSQVYFHHKGTLITIYCNYLERSLSYFLSMLSLL